MICSRNSIENRSTNQRKISSDIFNCMPCFDSMFREKFISQVSIFENESIFQIFFSDFTFENPKANSRTIFKYDDKGQKTEDWEVENSKYRCLAKYKHDDKGREIEKISYSNNLKDSSIETYKYDARGYQIEYTLKSSNGE